MLDADRLGPLELVASGRTLTPVAARRWSASQLRLDTLRHDGFAIRGELMESRICMPDDAGVPDGEVVTGMEWEPPCGPIPDDLAHPRPLPRDLGRHTVLVPVGGLRCLKFLAELTSGATCALVADKGHCRPVDLCSHEAPSVVFHGNGFSLMVNFDFLARYVREGGGVAILPGEPARSLVVAAFVQGDLDDPAQFESSVRDQLVDIGPDNYFTLRPLLSGAGQSIETMLAGLRLSRFDPALLIELLQGLLEVLPTVPDSMRSEIERLLVRVGHYFPIGEPIDMALCVGLGLSAMGASRAVDFLSCRSRSTRKRAGRLRDGRGPAWPARPPAGAGVGGKGAGAGAGILGGSGSTGSADRRARLRIGAVDVPRDAGLPVRGRVAGRAGHLRRPAVHPHPVHRQRRAGTAVRSYDPFGQLAFESILPGKVGPDIATRSQLIIRSNWRLLTGAFRST